MTVDASGREDGAGPKQRGAGMMLELQGKGRTSSCATSVPGPCHRKSCSVPARNKRRAYKGLEAVFKPQEGKSPGRLRGVFMGAPMAPPAKDLGAHSCHMPRGGHRGCGLQGKLM